jgi:hypothetical protein
MIVPIVVLVFSYESETSKLMGSEEAGVFEKRLLRNAFGPRSYETVER